ncbi:hypothetical protein [Paraeggerthella sp.]|uniref:hypothetical protein n=1 Tax=Paraeggerthella sp. TaxID=2897350 RepID=UPI0035290C29
MFEGKPRTHQLVRTKIWQHMDKRSMRTGAGRAGPPGSDLRSYAAYILDAPAILVPCKKEQWCYSERTFGDIYADRAMTSAEVEHARVHVLQRRAPENLH